MSLWQAMKEVERLLVGETVVVEFATEKSKETFREIAERLGAKVR
jgi:TusA-related sulfurtransferase